MRDVPETFAAHLAGGASTVATCWILRRADGAVLGFTDHDAAIVLGGVTCEAASGLTASAATENLGFAVGEGEVSGALQAAALDEVDFALGRYDGARIEVHLVNWAAPAERLHLRTATIGEVTRAGGAFRAELRGLAHQLDEPQGRVFARGCDATVGDARCGVNLDTPARRGTGAVTGGDGRGVLLVSGLSGFASGWFAEGRMEVTSGPMAGVQALVSGHAKEGGLARIVLWRELAGAVAEGTSVVLTAGCDRRFETCRGKFGNAENFRGFPHIPGNDFVMTVGRRSDANDGGVLFE
jgi:uncharacterized phage protein (TIGR02218 family)